MLRGEEPLRANEADGSTRNNALSAGPPAGKGIISQTQGRTCRALDRGSASTLVLNRGVLATGCVGKKGCGGKVDDAGFSSTFAGLGVPVPTRRVRLPICEQHDVHRGLSRIRMHRDMLTANMLYERRRMSLTRASG